MNRHAAIAAASAWLLVAVLPLRAQAPAGCTYDRCAIRFEDPYLVRGMNAERLARIGSLSVPNLQVAVQGSDTALRFARLAEEQHRRGVTAGIIGLVVTAATMLWSFNEVNRGLSGDGGGPGAGFWVGAVAGGALGIVSAHQLREARRSLARAIWWYNRDLPR